MTRVGIRITSAATVALLVVIALIVRERYARERERQIEQAEFAIGTPESSVIRVLGKPDQELSGTDVAKYLSGFDPACVARASRKLSYSPPGDGGPYVSIYLDTSNRVLCVEHGFIAL